MIGHEAVRKNCKPFIDRGAQELRMHAVDAFVCYEKLIPFERAERQEISMEANVVERLEMFRLARDHAKRLASGAPGPAKAGRYD